MDESRIILAGTGRMAEEYLKALHQSGIIGNRVLIRSSSPERARQFASIYSAGVWDGQTDVQTAIVAVTPDRLQEITLDLLGTGVRHFLIEKPGALSASGLKSLDTELKTKGARAYLALNRRFYPSVIKAREMLAEDGGAINCHFDFTDLESHVLNVKKQGYWPEQNFHRWGLVNSVHPIDLAFFLAGQPVELSSMRAGFLSWHPSGSEFVGSGKTDTGALFSYSASFGGSGRWRVEIASRAKRLLLCPLEEIRQQGKTGFAMTLEPVDSEPTGVKAGLTGMITAFLDAHKTGVEHPHLVRLDEGVRLLSHVEAIFGYK